MITQEERKFWRKYMRLYPTPAERITAFHLKRLGYKFTRQKIRDYYIADFFLKDYDIILEIDGAYHKIEEQKLYDLRRDRNLKQKNWHVLHIKNEDILKPQSMSWLKNRIEGFIASKNINRKTKNSRRLDNKEDWEEGLTSEQIAKIRGSD